MAVNTFTGEAFADGTGNTDFTNACTLIPNSYATSGITQPEFKNPPFAYADTEYESDLIDQIAQYVKVKDSHTISFDAVQDTFYLEGDKSNSGYYGYLYKAIFPGKNGVEKTIVQDDDTSDDHGLPGKLKEVPYQGNKNNMVGTYTPPTIVVSLSKENDPHTPIDESRANSINLNLTNDLPVNVELAGNLPQTTQNLENQSQYTNIHYHGFNVSPLLGADDVLVEVQSNVTPNNPAIPPLPGGYYPGSTKKNSYGGPISEYKMNVGIPDVHQSGVFWYHSHAHSLSDNQVRGGLSGGIIITGSDDYYRILSPKNGIQVTADTSPKLEIDPEPERFSVNQKIMMFKDFNNQIGAEINKGEKEVNCFTVNGQLNPEITIRPGEVQLWRMANVGADTYMNIALEKLTYERTQTDESDDKNYDHYTAALANPNGEQNFYILARDGNFVRKVVSTDSVLLPPASRVDVLVVGGNTADGTSTYNLVSDLTTNLTQGQRWVGNPSKQKSYVLATVDVSGDQVCYETKRDRKLSLKTDGITCNGSSFPRRISSKSTLYGYIKSRRAISQTRKPDAQSVAINEAIQTEIIREGEFLPFGAGDFPGAVDKILPNPTWLFFDFPDCKGNQNFVNNFCLTPPNAYSEPLTKKRYFYFNQNSGKFFLEGFEDKQLDVTGGDSKIQELYDGNRIDKVSEVGDLEEWHLINATQSPHVFHIHQLDFVVTQVNLPTDPCTKPNGEPLGDNEKCTYNNYTVGTIEKAILDPSSPQRCDSVDGEYKCPLLPQGYRDVINLPPNSETTVRIPFVNPFITGPFVYHCHILAHEDRGMMNNMKVVNTKGYGESNMRQALIKLRGIVQPHVDKMKQKMRERK